MNQKIIIVVNFLAVVLCSLAIILDHSFSLMLVLEVISCISNLICLGYNVWQQAS
jgi:MFS-type transporter involved in bile tolerance (Atg22 family)